MTVTECYIEAAPEDAADGRHYVEFGRCFRLMYPVDMIAFGLALLDFAPALANADERALEDFGRALVAAGMRAVSDEGEAAIEVDLRLG